MKATCTSETSYPITTWRHNSEDGDSMVLRNVGILSQHYMAS